MADSSPLPVAVLIAAYNRSEWVGQAVASALNQRPRPPAEVIVIDDASTDGTAEVAARAGARVLRHTENRGAAAARNTGAGATTQPWLAPLDSDDRWLPHMLSTLWPHHDGYGFVAGASLAIDTAGRRTEYGGTLSPEPVVLRTPATLVFPGNFVSASGVIVNHSTFMEVGGYVTRNRQAEDLDLWIRMLQVTSGLCVPQVVTLYRIHPAQKSRRGLESRGAVLEIVERHRNDDWCTPALLESKRAVLAWDDMREALNHRNLTRLLSQATWLARRGVRRRALHATLLRRRENRRRAASWADEYPEGDTWESRII